MIIYEGQPIEEIRRLYNIEEPSPTEVMRCLIAMCGGEVYLDYLKKFLKKNNVHFYICGTNALEKRGIFVKKGICKLEKFYWYKERRSLCEELKDYYWF